MLRSRLFLALAAALLALSTTGCLGRFALTASARKFNLDVTQDQWGRELVFIGMYIIPVYPLFAFADILVINSIEFWTEENPLSGERAITLTKEDGAESPADSIAQAPEDPARGDGQPPPPAGAEH